MTEKYDFWWVELAQILSELEQEKNHIPGPDWDRVERSAIELAKLVKGVMRDRDNKNE